MEELLCELDVCGSPVKVILTDDDVLLGMNINPLTFGRYSVYDGTIWLSSDLAPHVRSSYLFHEVYEYTLAYFNLVHNPVDEHESFMRFSNIIWSIFKRNKDILLSDTLGI